MRLSRSLLALALAGALVAAAAGSDDSDSADTLETTVAVTEPETTETTSTSSGSTGEIPKVTGALGSKPSISKPEGDPPTELVIKDIKVGDGKEAKAGDQVSVQYAGWSWSTGEEFDASWGRGEPFTFQLGAGQVIPGWDEGVEGMKVGGRRELVIPPDLAYGEQGSPPAIGPNETLVFVVDLEKVSGGGGG
jgi:peptidylprolyl isomerase